MTAVATITVDTDGPLDLNEQPVWPPHISQEPALYVRRVIVSRAYAGLGIGAALLDWAADLARTDYQVGLIRIDVWTTNLALHAYYEKQRFSRRVGRDPQELPDYPAQALFERVVDEPGSNYWKLLAREEDVAERGHA